MRLTCPNCDAQYEVANGVIPDHGRDVQCSNCGHTWFENPFGEAPEDDLVLSAEVAPEAEQHVHDDFSDSEEDESAMTPPPASRRSVDESVLNVLREEAEFEARARSGDAPSAIETQPDLGLENATPTEEDRRREAIEARTARLRGGAAVTTNSSEPARRRELLPDIEDINSTLRASEDRDDFEGDGEITETAEKASRGGFRIGFALTIILFILAYFVYAKAPEIIAQFPQFESQITGYVAWVDGLRSGLDQMVGKGLELISSYSNGSEEG
ncbi:zinc-ribbon domain-containing protein [Cochlodiniinecator piscidefendens]|uniref:zinc-ribbon domain-containing protein n=1 Tax=Cochlodiniinecator piscidefendens TaxID=2715756 RepID=UPI00140B0C39|nr:zinc-ribbon domain-containing protein [Cochlodiniinecator piscidefendens]